MTAMTAAAAAAAAAMTKSPNWPPTTERRRVTTFEFSATSRSVVHTDVADARIAFIAPELIARARACVRAH
jgi:hypothetical protein